MVSNRVILLIGGRTYRANSLSQRKLKLTWLKVLICRKSWLNFTNQRFRSILETSMHQRPGRRICEENPVRAVISVDDDATVIAARACDELDLTNNSPDAAYVAKNKSTMRERLATTRRTSTEFPSLQY
jgi:hypothetical protein